MSRFSGPVKGHLPLSMLILSLALMAPAAADAASTTPAAPTPAAAPRVVSAAATRSAAAKVLYACVTRSYKTLNLSTRRARCPRGQVKVSWNVRGLQGTGGAAGAAGATGPAGPLGPIGSAGPTGPSGPAGPLGPIGPAGPAGPLGPIGPIGASGPKGDTGAAGAKGDTGATGAAGPAGADVDLSVPLNLAQSGATEGVLQTQITNAGSGSRAIDVLNAGVGPGVFVSAKGNGLWATGPTVSAAAVIGDSSAGEAVVARQNGAGCELNIGKCNGIGAVVGRHDGEGGYGVRGFVTDPNGAIGVLGQSGISGGTGPGVRGENVNAANPGNAVEGVTNGTGAGVFGQGTTAGRFNGNVVINGDLTVTGTKSGFRIDDPRAPQTRAITHTPVETDALTVVYTGNVKTDDDGRATVRLPDYATELAGEWRYQLTPIGRFGQAIVEDEVDDQGRFVVRTENGSTKVSWSVTGVRKDPQATRHAIDPVATKTGAEAGTYLDPALYGAPASKAAISALTPATDEDGSVGGRRLASDR